MLRPLFGSFLLVTLLAAVPFAVAGCGSRGGAAPTSAPQLPPAAPSRATAAAAPTVSIIATTSPSPTAPPSPSPSQSAPAPATPATTAVSSSASGGTGYLEGKVSIGPLTPVQRAGVPAPTPSPEVCTSRGLAVYQQNGTTLVTSFNFQPDCSYRVPLSPGTYMVDLKNKPAIGGSKDLPQKVTIQAGKTTRLDISIDTGIR